MRYIIFLCTILMAYSGFSQEQGLMFGTPLPDPLAAGPTVQSKHVDIQTRTDDNKLVIELPVHAPEGAILAVLSEHEADVYSQDSDKALPTLNRQGLGLNDVTDQKIAVFAQLDTLDVGFHTLSIRPISQPHVTMRFVEKQSPLVLFAQTKPLAVTQSQSFTLRVWLEDEEPVHLAQVTVRDPKGRQYALVKKNDGTYQSKIPGPKVRGRELLYYQVRARGSRFDGSPFLRTATVGVMAIESQSGFAGAPKASRDAIDLAIQKATGDYRLELIYGHQGKSIAWQRTRVVMEGKEKSLQIMRPESATAADSVIIKLLNMDTLGLEDVVALDLPYDAIAYKNFVFPKAPSRELPAIKKKALEP